MTIEQAKDQAAMEAGYKSFYEYSCEIFSSSKVLNRALEIYGQAQRTEGIKEGFAAAREGYVVGLCARDCESSPVYPTPEDYLNSKTDNNGMDKNN